MGIYEEMKKAAGGFLESYKDDLYVHDRDALAFMQINDQRRFLWILRPAGTHLYVDEKRGGRIKESIRAILEHFNPEDRFAVWDHQRKRFFLGDMETGRLREVGYRRALEAVATWER